LNDFLNRNDKKLPRFSVLTSSGFITGIDRGFAMQAKIPVNRQP